MTIKEEWIKRIRALEEMIENDDSPDKFIQSVEELYIRCISTACIAKNLELDSEHLRNIIGSLTKKILLDAEVVKSLIKKEMKKDDKE